MACNFEVYLVGSCTLISKLKYYHFGRLLGDHSCAVFICIITVQYISIYSIFLSHSVLSSADFFRMISSVVSSGQKLIAIMGYLDNVVDKHTQQSTDKGY